MIHGSCLCGAIRFEIAKPTGPFELCHCSRCRKVTGSAFFSGLYVRIEDFRLVAGKDLISTYEAPILREAPAYRASFCSQCGSPVPNPSSTSGVIEIPAGLLDDDPAMKPDKHIFIELNPPWFEIADALPQYGSAGLDCAARHHEDAFMMRRDIFTEEHEMFRAQVRRFVDTEIEPKVPEWNRAGMSDRASWRKMGEAGFLGANAPAEYGGGGVDFIYDAIVMEELSRVRAHGLMMSLHSDICMPYIASFGNEEQKRRYLPGAIAGEIIMAIAMTEPGTGSDLAAVQTTARRDGDHYVINGSKIFISNGQIADLVIVACKTDPKAIPPHKGVSLMLVDASAPGFVRGRKLDKLGLRGQDTSELFFEDCRVPAGNLLGKEGTGFKMLMEKLQQERLCIGVGSMASCRRTLEDTIAYCKNRRAFGQPIAEFQNTQFKLAEMMTEVEVGQAFVDKLLQAHVRGDEIVAEVSMAKWWTTDLQKKISSQCLQLHGGYGFMMEYPVSTDYADAAVQSIYAGTNEIMKVIIARRMGLETRK